MNWSTLTDRPLLARATVGAWLVLLATLPMGFRSYHGNHRIGLFTWEPSSKMGVNFHTYHYVAELALAGESFYDVAPPGTYDWAVYLYPPITAVAYYPFTLVDWETGYALLVGLSVVASVAATALIVDYVESMDRRLGWIDVALILAAFLLSTHAFGTIYYGNINLLLAFAFVFGFWALARERETLAGVAFGLCALFKIFPALVGLWLLRDRRWRAIKAAVATGIGGLIAGLLLFGVDTTVHFFTSVLPGRAGSLQFVGGHPIDGTYYLTIQQPLSHPLWAVWPTAPYEAVVVLAILVCAPVLAYFYRDVETQLDRLMAIFVTVVVMLVLFPAFRWYIVLLYLPLIALLYVWEDGPGRIAFVAGGVLTSFTYSTEPTVALLDWLPEPLFFVWYQIAGYANPPLYGMGLMVAACVWYKSRTERTSPGPDVAATPGTADA